MRHHIQALKLYVLVVESSQSVNSERENRKQIFTSVFV